MAVAMPADVATTKTMRDFGRRYLMDALRESGGRVGETAAQIGISRATLYRRIAALDIEV